jgi:hypothetical protein
MMWALLNSPVHVDHFRGNSSDWAPMLRVVKSLAEKDYASTLFAFTSLDYFCIMQALP